MNICPVCRQSVDPKGRVVHTCAPGPDLPPPPRPEQSGFVPPPAGSRWPMFALIGVVVLSLLAAVVLLLTGGDDTVEVAASTTDTAVETTAVETTAVVPVTTVAITLPPATTPAATAPPPTEPPVEQSVASTGCGGSTDTGNVPIAFMESLLSLGEITNCRFAGRWVYAIWSSPVAVRQESGVFSIDQPVDRAFVFPLAPPVPASCVLARVNDPAIAAELSIGLPPGPCQAS